MIRLKHLLNEVIACGECVQWAWKYYMTNQHDKKAKVVLTNKQKGDVFYTLSNLTNIKKQL